MTTFFSDLISNKILLIAASGWFVAQFLKVIINLIINHEFDLERFVGAGGMPSSHSSTVCALVVATCAEKGAASFEFAMALFFAIIVIYDARGVRYETSKQAVVLNKLIEDLFDAKNAEEALPKLKELVGHTPFQVLVGGLLGLIIGTVGVLLF